MGTSSSSDSVEDEAGDAGSRGEFMVEHCTPCTVVVSPDPAGVMTTLPAGPRVGDNGHHLL
jgi:hypothetical protein